MKDMADLPDRGFSVQSAPETGTGRDGFELQALLAEAFCGRPPEWALAISGTLADYVRLAPGWDSYDGKPLRRDTADYAMRLLCEAMSDCTPLPSLVPLSCGGVQCEWHENAMDLELYIAGPCECELAVRDGLGSEVCEIKPGGELESLKEQLRCLVDAGHQRLMARSCAGTRADR
ncbi:MAG: hypothetical protein FWD68_21775 [Alphaproteobacteria bacterium]|nr:hypothetical protein [Alphaproteobacteria bacterium]